MALHLLASEVGDDLTGATSLTPQLLLAAREFKSNRYNLAVISTVAIMCLVDLSAPGNLLLLNDLLS